MKRVLTLLLCAACAGEDPPPDDLSEPAVWLIGGFDERDDELDPHLIDLADYALGLDPAADWAARAFAPGLLQRSHVADLDGPPWTEDQATLAVVGLSEHDLDAHRRLIELADRRCVDAPEASRWTRAVEFGEGCFVAGACDEAWVHDELEQGGVHTSLDRRYRALQLSDDRDAMVARTVLPADATTTGPISHWYGLSVWVSDPEDHRRTWRIESVWQAGEGTRPRDDWQASNGSTVDAGLTATESWLDLNDPPPCEPAP
jgi:hypothetical protein